MAELYVGIMSGTSMDGIDAVLVDFQNDGVSFIESQSLPFPKQLKEEIVSMQRSGRIDIEQLMDCDVILGRLYARAVNQLLEPMPNLKIQAIGCHGQTLWHRPLSKTNRFPSSWQIGDPNIIAEQTGITTVADFRRRDIAAGGQGAPLVTAFHRAVFRTKQKKRLILNLGGIANVTVLKGSQVLYAFDSGPGNALMDDWISRKQDKPFDKNGAWAKEGQVHPALLGAFKSDSYFLQSPPKSTGREYFNLNWLNTVLSDFPGITAEDVQATVGELTAYSIYQAVDALSFLADEVIVCGGGVNNSYVMERLKFHFNCPIRPSDALGVGSQWVEAMAFAWLAKQRMSDEPSNVPATTGAKHAVTLGAIYAPQL